MNATQVLIVCMLLATIVPISATADDPNAPPQDQAYAAASKCITPRPDLIPPFEVHDCP